MWVSVEFRCVGKYGSDYDRITNVKPEDFDDAFLKAITMVKNALLHYNHDPEIVGLHMDLE